METCQSGKTIKESQKRMITEVRTGVASGVQGEGYNWRSYLGSFHTAATF